MTLILHEAGKYPPNFFRRNSLPGINLLNRVKVNGLDYYGGYATSDGKFGLAYDAEIFEKNREYFRGVFHHELYHVLDYKDGVDKDNAAWREIHNCGCQAYLEIGGRDNLPSNNPQQKQLTADWFLTDYSRRNPVEDRAVMAQNLFIPSEHRRLQQRIASMQDLQLKDIWQKKYRWILDNYQKWSNDTMNEAYWGDLLKDKVNLSYFAR